VAALKQTVMINPKGTSTTDLQQKLKTNGAVRQWMEDTGTGLILMLERSPPPGCAGGDYPDSPLAQAAASLLSLRHYVDASIGMPTTHHMHMGEQAGVQALPLHAHTSDVLVLQVNGTKTWEVCTPAVLPGVLADHDSTNGLTVAQLAATHEIHIRARWDEHKLGLVSTAEHETDRNDEQMWRSRAKKLKEKQQAAAVAAGIKLTTKEKEIEKERERERETEAVRARAKEAVRQREILDQDSKSDPYDIVNLDECTVLGRQ
jgi:hypothetical protein